MKEEQARWETSPRRRIKRDSKIEKWQSWLDEKIRSEVVGMYHHRRVYRTLGEIIERHGSLPPSSVFAFIRDTYIATQSMAVRRQAETGERVISLGRLLKEISDDAERLTRDWYTSLFDADDQRHANRTWDSAWSSGAGEHVDPAPVRNDLVRLRTASVKVRKFADRHLAHHDRDPLRELPTFSELNAAIDVIGDLFKRYASLLTASYWPTLVPVVQYNWLAPFLEPWIKDEAVLFDIMSEHPVTGKRS